MQQPLVIAHRGASALAVENTMAAFALAAQQGADMIELDVRPAADGVLVVFHDETTLRWNGAATAIAALPWATLQHLDLRGERMPLLAEVCDWAKTAAMPLNIEIKVPGIEAAVVAAAGVAEQVIISSFYPQVLRSLSEHAPQLRRAMLMGVRTLRPRIRVREALPFLTLRHTRAHAWHPAYQLPFLPRIVRAVQRRGYEVNVWTVDEPPIIRWLIGLGVNGIISNEPSLVRELVDAGPLPVVPRPRRLRRR